ncbi:MAG: capsid cement protein [Candidatus Nanopelagicales bacterium]
MAVYEQISSTPSLGDFPFKNYGGSTVAANLAVIIDTSNVVSPTGTNNAAGIALPGSAGVSVVGVTTADIAAGATGIVRTSGIALIKCEGAITAGTMVQASATALKVGWAKAHSAAAAQIGMAITSSTEGELIAVLLQPAKNA